MILLSLFDHDPTIMTPTFTSIQTLFHPPSLVLIYFKMTNPSKIIEHETVLVSDKGLKKLWSWGWLETERGGVPQDR